MAFDPKQAERGADIIVFLVMAIVVLTSYAISRDWAWTLAATALGLLGAFLFRGALQSMIDERAGRQ